MSAPDMWWTDDTLEFVGPPEAGGGRVVFFAGQGSIATVELVTAAGSAIRFRFLRVSEILEKKPLGMRVATLKKYAHQAQTAYVFENEDETDDAHLQVVAECVVVESGS